VLAETRNTDSRSSSSLFKYGRASRGKKYAVATFILSLVALLDFVEAQDFALYIYNASLDLDSTEVGVKTKGTLSMTRLDGARTKNWETGKCFELFIWSPYKDWRSYKPF